MMDDQDEIKAFLRQKVEEIRSTVDTTTRIAAIRKYYPEIKALLEAGASHRMVVDLLKQKGIVVSMGTFAGYLTEVRQEDPDYIRPRRKARPRAASESRDGPARQPAAGDNSVSQHHLDRPKSRSLSRNFRTKL